MLTLPLQLQSGHDCFFVGTHLFLHLALVHVVIAQQVQDGMDGQVADLALKAVAVFLGLGTGALHRDAHIAQGHKAGFGIGIVLVRMFAGC